MQKKHLPPASADSLDILPRKVVAMRFSPATLLRLDPRDLAGLVWTVNRSRFLLACLQRRRQGLLLGETWGSEEEAMVRALSALEEAASQLVTVGGAPSENGAGTHL